MAFQPAHKSTLFVVDCEPQWTDLTRDVLARLRTFLADSNQVRVLSSVAGAVTVAFENREALGARRDEIESHLARGGHVVCWLDFSPRLPTSLFFFTPVAAVHIGGSPSPAGAAGVGGAVGDATCSAGVDATARAVLELLGSFDGISTFKDSFDGLIERERAHAARAERAARLQALANEARALLCKTCGSPTCGRVRHFLKVLPADEAEDVKGRLRALISSEGRGATTSAVG